MEARAAAADKFHDRFPRQRYHTALAEARNEKTTRARRAYIYNVITKARSKIENQFGVRGRPIFAELGYFRCAPCQSLYTTRRARKLSRARTHTFL